jgi:hypothetical protein
MNIIYMFNFPFFLFFFIVSVILLKLMYFVIEKSEALKFWLKNEFPILFIVYFWHPLSIFFNVNVYGDKVFVFVPICILALCSIFMFVPNFISEGLYDV